MEQKNPYKRGGLFEGALPTVFENAKHLRKNMTQAETVSRMYLREGISGSNFRRQHPIGLYIADVYCYNAKLVADVDSSIPNTGTAKQNDEEKETYLAEKGYGILRFPNDEIIHNIEDVLKKITTVVNINIHKHSPTIGG